ncbi:MAG: hypothetical protein JWM07_423 [Candidatus Saccharibacteria bacterium]|jgi:hypothetical protein|nr:hypothetical protein [Candidatus Saccharibacteria bacterium]
MTSQPSDTKNTSSEPPAPEELRPQAHKDTSSATASSDTAAAKPKLATRNRHTTYRPSHKATFAGLSVVVAVLAINAGIITFVVKGQAEDTNSAAQGEVTISPGVLNSLGVSRNPVGNSSTELVVNPNSRFNGDVVIGSDVSVAGELKLNSKFTANDASLAKLEAGDTSLSQLNVNGDGTVTNMNLRRDLAVVGATRLQGPVTVSQLMTVNNNLNVSGSLAVGGTLSARSFQASSLVSDTTLTIGGHIITRGAAISVGRGAALSGADTVSISGNDAAGTVAVNLGSNASRSGVIANVAFRQNYGSTPRVVVTAVGGPVDDLYISRNPGGFSIGVRSITSGLSGAGYAFDYMVMQ